jgi:hypothetical protein
MYTVVGIQKLSETQKSRLRNGHSVRIKKRTTHILHITDAQIKKLETVSRKGGAYTIKFDMEQKTKHGSGLWGDIASKAKAFTRKHKDLINPIIGRVRAGAKSGINKLDSKANEKVDEYIQPIEGEDIEGNIIKGVTGIETGLGEKKKRGRPRKILTEEVHRKVRVRKGKGILGTLIKAVSPATIDAIDGAEKGKVSGMGAKRKPGRPRKRKDGALIAPDYSAGQ